MRFIKKALIFHYIYIIELTLVFWEREGILEEEVT